MRQIIISLIIYICFIASTSAAEDIGAGKYCPPAEKVRHFLRMQTGKDSKVNELGPKYLNKELIREGLVEEIRKEIPLASLKIRAKLPDGVWVLKEKILEASKIATCVYLGSDGKLPVLEMSVSLNSKSH